MYEALEFIDSYEVKAQNRDHEFSPVEAIALTCHTLKHSFGEIVSNLMAIADECPEDADYHVEDAKCIWEFSTEEAKSVSIHDTIVNTVYLWEKLANGESSLVCPSMYTMIVIYTDGSSSDEETTYSTFDTVCDKARELCDEDNNVLYVIIHRKYLDEYWGEFDSYLFNKDMDLISTFPTSAALRNGKFRGNILQIEVELDSPYKRGDIVKINNRYKYKYGVCKSSVVDGFHGYTSINVGVFSPDAAFKFDSIIVPLDGSSLEIAYPSEIKGQDVVLYLLKGMYERHFDIDMLRDCNSVDELVELARELYPVETGRL